MCKEIESCCTPIAPPWEAPQVIPAQLRRVNNLIFRKIGQIARTNGVEAVTPMHGWIMEYLYRHSETPVFQRDIEREFSITRSTVTNILQLMERKGYIAAGAWSRTPASSSWSSPKRAASSTKIPCSPSTRPTNTSPAC